MLISAALAAEDIAREIDGLAALGVQVVETTADGAALVRERSDLIAQVPASDRDAPCVVRAESAFEFLDVVRRLPPGSVFFGSGGLPVVLAALACGGHVRVSLSDTPEYAPGEPARSVTQLAARAVGLAKIAQRPPFSVAEARELLGRGAGFPTRPGATRG